MSAGKGELSMHLLMLLRENKAKRRERRASIVAAAAAAASRPATVTKPAPVVHAHHREALMFA